MLTGLRKLKERGAEKAMLGTSSENTAMQRAAESAGFRLAWSKVWLSKPIANESCGWRPACPEFCMTTKSFDELIAEALEARFSGWDFSWLAERWIISPLPWDYQQRVLAAFLGSAHCSTWALAAANS